MSPERDGVLGGDVAGRFIGTVKLGECALSQSASFDDGFAAEFVTDVVCGAFGFAAACGARVQQVSGKVRTFWRAEIRDAATDQAVGAGIIQLVKQGARRAVDAVSQLRWIMQRGAPGQGSEIRAFEFEGYDAPCVAFGFGAVGDLFREAPDMAIQNVRVRGVIVKGGFFRD